MLAKLIAANDWGRVELNSDVAGLPSIVVTHQACTAKVSLYGGQVLQWQPQGQSPVFWLSRDSLFAKGEAIRGGIPICWPWFGKIPEAGNHGFVRARNWQLGEVLIAPDSVSIRLYLECDHQSNYWPHSFRLVQDLVLGDRFEQSLTVVNNGDSAWEFTAALHTYFNISHARNVQIPGLAGVRYQDKLNDLQWEVSDEPAQIDRMLDRIYHDTQSIDIDDKGYGRRVCVAKTGSSQWVLWNPGPEGVGEFPDIHSGGEVEFVCLEAANTHAITVAAHSEFTWGQKITLCPL
jgi:glucose-6-phosphate 1-epimerase